MAKQPIITLLTDFGTRDPYVAAMKGAILSKAPYAQIVDITHDVPAHDILAASVALAEAAPCFPPGTLHVVVVDPGVGSDRAILAARFGGQAYLFPDNGVITTVATNQPLEQIVVVQNPAYVPPAESNTFHGRDLFAPLAAMIVNGLMLERLGPMPGTYKMLDIPAPFMDSNVLVGRVIYVDNFGNLVTNIRQADLQRHWTADAMLEIFCVGQRVGVLQSTYSSAPPGMALALINSMGALEVAVNQGRASDKYNAGVNSEVRVLAVGGIALS